MILLSLEGENFVIKGITNEQKEKILENYSELLNMDKESLRTNVEKGKYKNTEPEVVKMDFYKVKADI